MADIYELLAAVREHPDYVFGVIFTREDFAGGKVPQGFNAKAAEEVTTARGFAAIEDQGFEASAEAEEMVL